MPAPALPANALGRTVEGLDVEGTVGFVLEHMDGFVRVGPKKMARKVRPVLSWLEGFKGRTWEERWLASGADKAPRAWYDEVATVTGTARSDVVGATTALLVSRVVRPSYGWLLDASTTSRLAELMLRANDPDGLRRLRALPEYREALPRHQIDAEACMSRIVIRTGGMLDDIRGEQLLHYADLVKTTGRHRREHLAWELLVALGPLAEEPPTLRAAWSAKGNTHQHPVAMLVDRYGIPPSPVRDLLVDYLSELKPGMDYASLEGLSYRLVRLFWALQL
jgi:hypothetical protein